MKAVLFDLDNTLLDFMKMKRIASAQAAFAMVSAGLRMEEKKVADSLLETYFEVGIESEGAFQTYLERNKESYSPDDRDRILAAAINAYLKAKEVFLDPYPNVIPTLIKLIKKGLKLGILTDAPRLKAFQRLNAMGLEHFFDVVVCKDDTGVTKPNSLAFETAIKKLGIPASEILFVGDNPERDILGAHKAGMKTALAEYGNGWYKGEKVKSDFVLKDISELLLVLG